MFIILFILLSVYSELFTVFLCAVLQYRYLLLCKIYISLCQINKSTEVDYYKIRCNNEFKIVIPQNFSKTTSDYLEQVTKRYTFHEQKGFIMHDDLKIFDIRAQQPEINLYKVRFDSASSVQSMVKYIEISNVFRATNGTSFSSSSSSALSTSTISSYLIFIADTTLQIQSINIDDERSHHINNKSVTITINNIPIEIATIFFNKAISFVPCFKYVDSEDVILFTSRNIRYLVDKSGQFNENYYGMKHELIECITSEQIFVDLNDEHCFKTFSLHELLTESKTVLYFPDYLLQVQSRQQLINLLDLAIYIRNISFFILVLTYLRRASIQLLYIEREKKTIKITGPW